MKLGRICSAFLIAGILLIMPACALRKGPPDPLKVQRKIEETKSSERQIIVSTVEDPEKVSELLDLLVERDRLVARHADGVAAYGDKMRTLNASYDASRDEFEKAIADYNEFRRQSQKDFVDLIAKMKAATTAEQWKELSKYQLKKLNPRELAYSGEGV